MKCHSVGTFIGLKILSENCEKYMLTRQKSGLIVVHIVPLAVAAKPLFRKVAAIAMGFVSSAT